MAFLGGLNVDYKERKVMEANKLLSNLAEALFDACCEAMAQQGLPTPDCYPWLD